MLRQFTELIMGIVSWVGRGKIVIPSMNNPKLNLGSGLSVAPDWINVDASPNSFFSHCPLFLLKQVYHFSGSKKTFSRDGYLSILKNSRFIHYDVRHKLPFLDLSIQYIYTSHFLEHLYYDEAKYLLQEAHRILKVSGTIRIGVPNLEYAVSLYQKGEKERFLAYFFSDNHSNIFSRHKYMYDFDMLRRVLSDIGYVNIKACRYQEGKTPDIQILDNRPEETLFLEADKNNKGNHERSNS